MSLRYKTYSRFSHIIIEILLILLSLTVIYPLLVMILGSFKGQYDMHMFEVSLPQQFTYQNFIDVVEKGKLIRGFKNSMIIAVFSVALSALICSMAAFIVVRVKTRLTQFLYYFFYIGLILPVLMLPTIKILQILNLYNSFAGAIILYVTYSISFSIFLYSGFIKYIPKDMDEAAIIDGASTFRLFFTIIFPLLTPVSVTVAILTFMAIWNDITIPLYFFNESKKWTMPLSVYNFIGQYYRSWNLVFADLTITAVPVFIIYLLGQKYIVSGLTVGAVKT